MKHSGIEWIGEIPKEWRIGKVKNYYSLQTGFTPDTKNELYYDDNGLPWVNISDIGDSHYINTTKKRISQYYISKYNPTIVPKGSLLYSFKLSVGTVAIAGIDLYTNEAIASFLQGENVNLNYLFYSSQVCIIHNANENIYGAKLLNQDLINNATILFPSLPEQQKIANYLDKVCGEVDEMIALQEQMIEELKAYKQSVITEAVTKGLNPGVSMKDSGIDWIGEIPENWKVIRIKYLLKERKERSDTGLEEPLSMSQKYGLIPTKEMDAIPNIASSFVGAKLVYRHDLVFNKLKAHLGVFAESDYDGLVSPDYAVYYSSGLVDVKYLEYLFKSPQYIAEFIKLSTGVGAGLTRLYTSDLYSIYGIVPPIEIQREIVDYIRQLSSEINTLIAIKQAKIEELKDYKKSVIYEYVTGKKEVV